MADNVANVQRKLYGLGFSPLSIKNQDHAFPQEMLSQKDVGLFFIKGDNGNIVSAEYIARCKKHLEHFTQKCVNENTIGVIYKVNIDKNFVQTVINDDNLFVNSVDIPLEAPIKAFRFNIDADLISASNSVGVDPKDIVFEIQFSIYKNNEKKSYYVSENFDDINTKVFAVDYNVLAPSVPNVADTYAFSLDAFTVRVPVGFDMTAQTIVIHDVLFALI